jgi:hypothetical protein
MESNTVRNEVASRLAGMGARYFAPLTYRDLGIEPIGTVD